MSDAVNMIGEQFEGRKDALQVFYNRFSARHMKNGVYYVAVVHQDIVPKNRTLPTE